MYRNIIDNAVTYTPDDIVLFRESPFAAWMERLTLENPDHGIPADLNSTAPHDQPQRQEDIVATLRAEGRNVALIDLELEEPQRRTATLEAMRGGADFIVHGQLAAGTQSASTSLLMRTSGYSELGDFLYIPCETHARNTLQSAFRLCFVADLLYQLQGQLPPQMLIIRDGAEVVPLQTEDYIYYFRAVQKRFMHAMNTFRKHRMPDPAESSHFGRWAECASEVLKQRAFSEQQRGEDHTKEAVQEEEIEVPQLRVASGSGSMVQYESNETRQSGFVSPVFAASTAPEAIAANQGGPGHTLAEQARLLAPGSFRSNAPPGHTPNLARYGRPQGVPTMMDSRHPSHNRRSSDAALENLEFIGSSPTRMVVDIEPAARRGDDTRPAPAPTLREAAKREMPVADEDVKAGPVGLPDLEPKSPVFLPPDQARTAELPGERLKPRPRDSGEVKRATRSVIDLDSAPAPTLAPVVQRAEAEFERLVRHDPVFRKAEETRSRIQHDEAVAAVSPFSSSLMTSDELNDS